MSDIASISPGSLKGSDPRSASRKPLADEGQRYVLAAIAVVMILVALAFWFFSAAEPQEVERTVGPGDSLAGMVGYANAIEVAEKNSIPITAKLIASTISPADARKLEGAATDVVLVRVEVMPGAKISMTVDDNGVRVPDTPIIYTPAPR